MDAEDKRTVFTERRLKGYGTKKHLEALDKYGPIEGFHRFSYGPVLEAYNKDLKLKV